MSASRPIRIAAVLLLVCLLPVCALAQEQTLRISGPSFLSTDTTSITSAREAFSALHEGWTVEIADESAASETLAALESGEETADILVVTAADAVALGNTGLVLDLSAAPALAEACAALPGAAKRLYGGGEHCYALPVSLQVQLIDVTHPEILDAIGGAPEADWTWFDLLDLCNRLAEYNRKTGEDWALLDVWSDAPYWLLQMARSETPETMPYDTLEALAGRWTEAEKNGLITKDTEKANVVMHLRFTLAEQAAAGVYLAPPAYAPGAPASAIGSTVFLVNAAAVHAEEAFDFLACCSYLAPENLRNLVPSDAPQLWLDCLENGAAQRDTPQTRAMIAAWSGCPGDATAAQRAEAVRTAVENAAK